MYADVSSGQTASWFLVTLARAAMDSSASRSAVESLPDTDAHRCMVELGDYVLTLDDYLQRRSFDDEICRNSYFIDIHRSKDAVAKSFDDVKAWEKTSYRYEKGESHGLPYRCLTPRDLKLMQRLVSRQNGLGDSQQIH